MNQSKIIDDISRNISWGLWPEHMYAHETAPSSQPTVMRRIEIPLFQNRKTL